ncbi:MAG TPA: mannose-1-phosphate guanylyltransferase/mannose-6-phosphate isomerase, partial [Candidatus Aenigmarchaeota archaeon]|nr:mannose-1-phosphate guanylyltransferase/mannose-6-phosphate isomerase [Candidatus Aenigmarchaeota archaeon]
PISRTLVPKQFVKLFQNRSLFQLTVERNFKICENQLIISNQEQYFLAMDQLEELDNSKFKIQNSNFLLEPIGRDTACAIALGCFFVEPDEILLVTPSDHLIKDTEAYFDAVKRAKLVAEKGNIVTFGIKPEYPETGFGYIEATGLDVQSFKEKPNLETAKKYLSENLTLNNKKLPLKYLWNSGMFCFKASSYLEELQVHAPDIYKYSKQAFDRAKTFDFCSEVTLMRITTNYS